ncbi:hypothetical protein RDI58_006927 [Solanum bulbocastanum]|uniref:Endonuclease/exonuclease/phosphatase domain-containing protein n=1 Tax=Solanum bulbocastanum TaxID=147425 RepID=A0AAN8TVK2_SOLBU
MLVTWNVRGFNQEVKHKELRLFVKRNKVTIIAILEHRVRKEKAGSIINKIMPRWEWCTNKVRGRIWIVWNPNMVEFKRVESSVQYVHGMVDMQQSGFKFLFTAVYGLHTIAIRSSLWEKVKQLSTHIRESWLIIGDFNSILTQEDKPIWSQVQLA